MKHKSMIWAMTVLGAAVLFSSIGYSASEAPDPAYLKAIQRAKENRKADESIDTVSVQNKTMEARKTMERICLKGDFCMRADFSDAPDAKKFIRHCEQFEREYPNPPSRDLSRDAYACYSFLLGFGQALSVSSFLNIEIGDGPILCIGGAAERKPRMYLDFMKRNPDLHSKNMSYTVFRFFEEAFQCNPEKKDASE